ncbi:MAG: Gfo/Idh/MocA family oxidoreductase [Clostridiales bacterium]|jgi:predicted dehydrogenase|nr:Gfo/Idh/MocA family oxidoreductase [Clostridiales bacterium]
MKNKIKVGVFGAYRGKTMIDVLAYHPNAQLVAVCDKYRPLLDEAGKLADKAGIKVALYDNFEDFYNHDMDAVVLANYATEHATYAIRLLKSGRHILSEVLPCETMAQAVELIEAVEESGKVYAYAENYCYMDQTFEMWRRYKNGDIGEVTYAEGEYIHDCSSIWPNITYGDRDHWRNRMYSTYYCTHSIGPMITITGQRPVKVVGFETAPMSEMYDLGHPGGISAGIEIITFENGAIAKSVHGQLKREPGSINYEIYGKKGMMETERFDATRINVYIEGEELCVGELKNYAPEKYVAAQLASNSGVGGHNGSDFYATHFFIEKILGNSEGYEYSIDVYQAIDMGICGILAYRSILNGNVPVKVPNLRNKEERDAFRNDNACTTKSIAGDQLLPLSSYGEKDIPEEVYDRVRQKWLDGQA